MLKRVLSVIVLLSILISMMVPAQAATINNTVTNGEALKAIFDTCRIKPQIVDKSKGVYEGYILTAATRKAVNASTFRKKVNQKITRLELADLIVKGVPVDGLSSSIIFSDTKSFSANVITTAEIMGYTDNEKGIYFYPKSLVTKSELDKIVIKARDFYIANVAKGVNLTKVIKSTEYIKPNIDTADGLVKVNFKKNEDLKIAKYPRTKEDFKNILFYMVYEGIDTYKIDYNIPYFDLATSNVRVSLTDAFNEVGWTVLCYMGDIDYKLIETKTGSTFTFTLKSAPELPVEREILDAFLKSKKCIKIIKDAFLQLNKEGKLTAEMTETQKAKVIFEWICTHVTYDGDTYLAWQENNYNLERTGVKENSQSYKAVGAIVDKLAVCQGYTYAYNLMLNYLGITAKEMIGTTGGEGHAWTKAIVDGKYTLMDVTWGDIEPDDNKPFVDYQWFGRSDEFFKESHKVYKDDYEEWEQAVDLEPDEYNN